MHNSQRMPPESAHAGASDFMRFVLPTFCSKATARVGNAGRANYAIVTPTLLVVLLSAATLRAEIDVPKNAPTQRQAAEHDVAFRQKFLVEAYKTVGTKDARWDEPVIAFLTHAPRSLARIPGGPSLETLLEQSGAIREKGCKDALVRYFAGQILVQLGRVPEAEALEKGLAQEMVKQKYPAMWQFAADFPRTARFSRFDRLSRAASGASLGLGVFLFVNGWLTSGFAAPPSSGVLSLLWRFRRAGMGAGFWLLALALLVPALAAMVWRTQASAGEERRRA